MISACVTNLGKHNEGELCCEYLKLPATKGDVQDLLMYIGVDGVIYEEFFITDYETDIVGLYDCLGEYESIDELNYLASLLSDMKSWELEKFEAVIKYGEHTSSAKDLINLAQNLDCYYYITGIEDEEDLGRYYIEDLEALEIPRHLETYFDYAAYGRDVALETDGIFVEGGYVEDNRDTFVEFYGGRHDMPDEYKIFAYPDPPEKLPIKAQIEMFGKMVSTLSPADRAVPVHADR